MEAGKTSQKRVTLRDVAQEAGVSLKTASNVINGTGRMSDATRQKVKKVVQRFDYRVNVAARNLNRGKTGAITLAVPTLTAPYLAELANRIIDEARQRNYHVYVVTYGEGSAKDARKLLQSFNATVCDGMIFSMSEVVDITPDDLDVDFPLVVVGARTTSPSSERIAPMMKRSSPKQWKAMRNCVCAASSKRIWNKVSRPIRRLSASPAKTGPLEPAPKPRSSSSIPERHSTVSSH